MEIEKTSKSKVIIANEFIELPEGLVMNNWVFDGEPVFKNRLRKKKPIHVVIHETAGRTAAGCKKTLLKKKCGVPFIIERDGIISQHGDPIFDRMVHANQLNETALGLEFVNPYAPSLAKNMPHETIDAKWWTWCPDKEDRRYVLPSQKQMDVAKIFIPFLCEVCDIPYEFPTAHLNSKQRKCERVGWLKRRIPKAGVVAHRDFAKHADGRYLLEYLIQQSK